MTVGALLDAGAPWEPIHEILKGMDTGATYAFEQTKRHGIRAGKFKVAIENVPNKHRHLHHVFALIDKAPLSDRARANAKAVFQKLGESEAAVHGVSIEKVHFHEVGAADSIADIVGACAALDLLGIDEIHVSPINTGSGTVNTEHGVLPVPAPATASLLAGRPVYASGPTMELTTPTGAALATTLAASFGPMPAMKITSTGFGAGDRDFPTQANVLRVIVGERTGATEATTVAVIEANIDDSSPQVLGYAMEKLLAAGALDVTLSPLHMKKSRPGTLLSIIARPEDREHLAAIVFAETSTLGVRIHSAERRVQAREMVELETRFGSIRGKVANGVFAPEYDDCRARAEQAGATLRDVIAAAQQAYLK